MTVLAYRRDIDGLRAIAVLAVVLFHFGVPGVTGGFVGVDVFFVISGFLITSIIWRERQAGRFSFVEFWARRARRILPALFVMIVATLVAGWFLLAPKDYEELGRAAHYQVIFTSNLLFARQHGYFEAASDIKPLLHTWSLAVEEQFYILFPLLLTLLSSRLKHWRLALFGVLLVSFGMSVWAVEHEPQKAFFLLHLRAWELLAGAMLAVMPAREWRASPALAQCVSLAAMGLILIAVFGFDSHTAFPGATALLPVLGVVGLIWANGQQYTWVGRLLSSRLMVGLGLISYSWYLWHWPVFVYANYAAVDGLSATELGGLMLLSLVLGYLSWRFVETPFREKRLLATRKAILVAAAVGILSIGLTGVALRKADGVPSRLSEQALRYAKAKKWSPELMACMADKDTPDERLFCHFGPKNPAVSALVWGDSHATALIPALEIGAEKHDISLMEASFAGCVPLDGLENIARCAHFNRRVEKAMSEQPISDVVLAARWSLYLYGQMSGDKEHALKDPSTGQYVRAVAEQRFADGMRERIKGLRAAGHRVWLVKEVPLQEIIVPYRLSRLAMMHRPVDREGLPVAKHLAREAFISQLFDELAAADSGVRVLDPAPQLCGADGLCRVELNGRALYTDDNHLSDVGARHIEAFLEPLFSSLQSRGLTAN
ncbi:acyltransferase family protein [Pseudomonas poae]|uniref:Peptidoglycan/LPS O-acetylase OafA/YrhL, contains acyltransferase and SGNH-hydrolase domains n=2 Tax=Pseudomonas poae TaxID=200451 RepID=A0ABY0RPU2_9PSED|nr:MULTISPECIES: acyltransferase family protein [Pseudomonas]KRP53802.1 acyltransferase [Pseudomonas poae]MCF5775608.1 acyltransferase family protein [Pseudomonas poae]NMZ50690.1 acyltransferase [Pseudomonas poae]CRL97841.1 O-acetyltransferase OatA [Pseudomonas sp. 25 E 4]SDO35741.1 Peptidoglycan/LPS O-acetylase OafA/YrhL, contains acyltransferase and SGNH-hydrolase domains [Pseudomonas poae]